ncbi:MAG: hypothetical protein NAG76_03360 [Candidatus Pristimantibacillus lignocellulolyticus]|uniref:Uncharacterized protein n=1 Tax=Candidatus Pristimantibacillus lignocellulolyticus TaxID=2994561 RepID=A0A9J6ZGN8_9BACL|nr:MAG: hypothetical protein NAG76_03360 [Candidatus Pristimantibacillus lignocellulolyticus]
MPLRKEAQKAGFDNDDRLRGLFDIEYAPHRKPACAHVHKTYAVLLVSAGVHLLGSESPLVEPSLKGEVQKAGFDNDDRLRGLFDIEYAPHRKPACAHVHKTYAVLLVSAGVHLLGSESPLVEPSLKGEAQKAGFDNDDWLRGLFDIKLVNVRLSII